MIFQPKFARKFQEGGEMGAPEEPTAGDLGQDPIMMLAQMSALAVLNQDCQMAMQVCQAFLQVVQLMQGESLEVPETEPVYAKHGAKLVGRIRRH